MDKISILFDGFMASLLGSKLLPLLIEAPLVAEIFQKVQTYSKRFDLEGKKLKTDLEFHVPIKTTKVEGLESEERSNTM